MDLAVLLPLLMIVGAMAYMLIRRNGERAGNAPLAGEIQARVCFETALDHARILGTGGFGGTRGVWISLRGPKRLIVGTDAVMISAPQALREFVFTGRESSIAYSQMSSRLVDGDWIVITGQNGTRQVELAVSREKTMPEIWQALAGTGAALVPRS